VLIADVELKLRLSASQIKQWESCPRQYFYERVKGLRKPPSKGQKLGTEVHEHAEDWLTSGLVPPTTKAGQILKSALALLPPPKSLGMEVEKKFEFDTDGFGLLGFIDIYTPGRVYDLKTTRDFQYQLSARDLMDDIQAQLYAYVWQQTTEQPARDVPMTWVYMLTEGRPAARVTTIDMPAENGLVAIDRAKKAATGIKPIKWAPDTDPSDVEGNYRHCDAYGGCPHRSYCPVKTSVSFADFFMGGDEMGLKDKLKASLGKQEATPNEALPPVEPNTVTFTAEYPVFPPAVRTEGPITLIYDPSAVNPPDAAAPVDELPTLEEKPAAKKRGRPAKAEVAPPEASAATGFTLYVDCLPVKGLSPVSLDSLLRTAASEVAADTGLGDYRLVEYGKGTALFLLEFSKLFENTSTSGQSFLLHSRTPEASIVLSYLIDRAAVVVRGVAA
jgi:hypothetical protein